MRVAQDMLRTIEFDSFAKLRRYIQCGNALETMRFETLRHGGHRVEFIKCKRKNT